MKKEIEIDTTVKVDVWDVLEELEDEDLLEAVSERMSEDEILESCIKKMTDKDFFGMLFSRISGWGVVTPDKAKEIVSEWIDTNLDKSSANGYLTM